MRCLINLQETRSYGPDFRHAPPHRITSDAGPANVSAAGAAIEPKIRHLMSGFQFGRNFLHDIHGDAINLLLAADLSLWLRHAWACLDTILPLLLLVLELRPLSRHPLLSGS